MDAGGLRKTRYCQYCLIQKIRTWSFKMLVLYLESWVTKANKLSILCLLGVGFCNLYLKEP